MAPRLSRTLSTLLAFLVIGLAAPAAFAAELTLRDLVEEALKNNRDIRAAERRVEAYRQKIPQAGSLPDPMVGVGYQNDTLSSYTYGDSPDAKWMFEASQMFPFAGKRGLKQEMAKADAESQQALLESLRRRTVARVTELYHDLSLVYRSLDILAERKSLYAVVEQTALARYSSGMGTQQEVLMAQAEKYMIVEREEMLRQKRETLEGMINLAAGRDVLSPLGRPAAPVETPFEESLDDLIRAAEQRSPEIRARERMAAGTEAKVSMARREYFPDVTVTAGVETRSGPYTDMYKLLAGINLPVFFKSKQEPAVQEALAAQQEARQDLEGTRLMVASAIRENYAMVRSAGRLMELYRSALIPKSRQDFEAALAGYNTGRGDALTVATRLKGLLDYELQYWGQFAEREKAIARIEALSGESRHLPAAASKQDGDRAR
jgi:outer membrane protein TolC